MELPHARVVICGYYGFGNTGDELILAAMLHELRTLRPGLAATVISGNPASTMASHGVNAVHWQDAPAIAAQVRTADLVLVGGGGLFQEYSGIDPDSLFTDRHYAITFYAEPAILGGLFGRPVMLYAMGVGPLTSEHGRRMVRAACDAAQVITLRDEESASLVASLGVEPARLRVTADPVFALPDAAGPAASAGLAPALPAEPGLLVGISVRHWDIGVASYFWEHELAAGLDAFLETHEAHLLFVPFQRLDRAPENDTAVAERVRSLLRHPERATVLSGDRDATELQVLLGRCDLVVGMRLHAMILAAVAGVPSVALSYDAKVEHAMRQIGAEQFVVPLPDIEARTVALRMGQALSESKAGRKGLRERVAHLAELARSNAVAAIELLDRGSATRDLSPALSTVVARTMTSRFAVESTLRGEVAAFREAKSQTETATAELERARAALGADLATRLEELGRLQEELSRQDAEMTQAKSTLELQGAELQAVRAELAARTAAAEGERVALGADLEARTEELRRQGAELQAVQAELAARTAAAEGERAALGADLATAMEELDRLQDELLRRDGELTQARSALESQGAALQAVRVELAERTAAAEGERAALGADLATRSEELLRVQEGLSRRDGELAEARGVLERQSAQLQEVRVELAAKSAELKVEAALRGEMDALREARSQAEIAVAELERAALGLELETKSDQLRRFEEDLLRRDGELEQAKSLLERQGGELRQVRAELAAETTELEEAQDELSLQDEELARVKGALERRGAELAQVRADLVAETAELEEAQAELARQDDELAQARSTLERQGTELERFRVETAQLRDRGARVHDELLRIHRSRLWKLGSRYWRFLEMIGRLPAKKG